MPSLPSAPNHSRHALSGGGNSRDGTCTVVRSVLRSSVHSASNRRHAKDLAWEWVGSKWPRLVPSLAEMEREHFECSVPGQELSFSTSGDGSVWSLSVAYSERKGTRSWMTRALVADADDSDVMGLQTSCSEAPDAPLVVAPPKLLGAWVERLALEDGTVAVLGAPREVNDEKQLGAFCGHVMSRTRALPVIALTNKPNTRYYGVDPNGLAEAVRGLAHIACVDPSVSPQVKERLGADFGLVAGAARIYAPRFHPDAPVPDHPLVRNNGNAGGAGNPEDAGAFRRLLIRRICAMSVSTADNRDVFQ